MDKQDRIYVAGHRGLVGSAIVRRLQADGYDNLIARASKEAVKSKLQAAGADRAKLLVIAVDAPAVNMTFALSHADYLVVLMQCMRQTQYHRKHQAECQNQACNCFAHLSIHALAKIRK